MELVRNLNEKVAGIKDRTALKALTVLAFVSSFAGKPSEGAPLLDYLLLGGAAISAAIVIGIILRARGRSSPNEVHLSAPKPKNGAVVDYTTKSWH